MSILYYLFAASTPKLPVGGSGIDLPKIDAAQLLNNGLNLAYFAAGIVAVIVIILSGYTFATAVYDPAKITQAKNDMLYAVVGLVAVISAFLITQFLMGKF